MANKLRFAALVRVSTEKQEKQGESLRTQRASNERDVKSLGGTIVDWYGRQEHATPGYEKAEVERLLRDAKRKKFDAVIVAYADRWSRDNESSKPGLRILRDNGIAFYVGQSEMNLHSPETKLFLGMSAEIGEFTASQQNKKSMENRIARAKRGVPSAGKLPPGRTYNGETEKWGIDKKFRDTIQQVAKRYLAGEAMAELANEYGMNHPNLHKTLMERCGEDWQLHFDSDAFNIHEVVPIKVPRLLDEQTIDKLRKRAQINKTCQDRKAKYEYALSGKVFCAQCGYRLMPQSPNRKGGHIYYRHSDRDGAAKCKVRPRPYVRADELDNAVLRHILDFYGNPKAIQKAIEDATPNKAQHDETRQRIKALETKVAQTQKRKKVVLGLILRGVISDADAEKSLKEAGERETRQREEIDRLQASLEKSLSGEEIRAVAEHVSHLMRDRFGKQKKRRSKLEYGTMDHMLKLRALEQVEEMTFEQKRELVKDVFDGTTLDGKPMGVYVEAIDGQSNHRSKVWRYKLCGNITAEGEYGETELPTTDEDKSQSAHVSSIA